MLLFIAQQHDNLFGGGVIADRNLKICKEVIGSDNVITYLLPAKEKGGISTLKTFLTGYLLGLSPDHEGKIITLIKSDRSIRYVFIDSSLLGRLTTIIKTQFPDIQIIVFFHNVEFSFFKEFLKTTKRYVHSIGLPAIYKNEKSAVKYADTIITLNQRDSDMLQTQYGRSCDFIWPISINDNFDIKKLESASLDKPLLLLFVGSRFYPNEHGIAWFIKEVMPHLKNVHLKIVGKGFEALRQQWNTDQIEVIGTSADMTDYYYQADIVIAPIFTGSGMKTKTAEAMMYGKTIMASTESFEGYNLDKKQIGGEFNTAQEYIDGISAYSYSGGYKFNEYARKCYLDSYSYQAACKKFKDYFNLKMVINHST